MLFYCTNSYSLEKESQKHSEVLWIRNVLAWTDCLYRSVSGSGAKSDHFAIKIWSIFFYYLLVKYVVDHTYIFLKCLEKLLVSPNLDPYIHIKFDIFLLDIVLGLYPEPDLEPDLEPDPA
jgi:hypothetical protein